MQSEHLSFFALLQRVKGRSTKAKMVYLYICFAEQAGQEVVGQETMAADLELSADSVNRGLKELREHGLIAWKNRGLTLPNTYRVVHPGDAGQSSEGAPQS